jgi:hypothetical protein
MSTNRGRKVSIDYKKIEMLFDTFITFHASKKYIAQKLGLKYDTFLNVLKYGEKYVDEHAEILEKNGFFEVENVKEYEDQFNDNIIVYQQEFKEIEGIEINESIPRWLKDKYDAWIKNKRLSFLESIVYKKQKQILNEIILYKDNEKKDNEAKLTILFYMVYVRADNALFSEYSEKFTEALQDTRNVKILENRMKKRDKEEFQEEAPEPQQINHKHEFIFIEEVLKTERLMGNSGYLEDKSKDNDDIIDAEFE